MRILICSALILLRLTVTAQSVHNGSVISISSNSILFVTDTLVNNGTIVNNGDMQIGGSWINNAQYDAGEGQITFNSDLPQVINHNDQSFSRLTISGGGEKIFQANITIENELQLTDGILVAQNNSRIVFTPSAHVSGGSDIAHINGPVYHQGPGDKVFPVGNGEIYLPVELLNIEGSSPEVGVKAVELDNTTLQASRLLKAVSTNRYWEVDVISGSLSNSRVILPVRDEDILTDNDKIVVAQSASLNDAFESLGQSAFEGTVTNGMVTSEEVVSRSFLAIAAASSIEGLVVYNAISPNNDQSNDFLIIGNIESYPSNKFTVFNRWGDKVFEIANYDNKERVFRGKANVNGEKDLVNGTYFYVIETKEGTTVNGFLALKH